MANLVPMPDAEDLSRFLGMPLDSEQSVQAQIHLGAAESVVRAYTRGAGFTTTGQAEHSIVTVILSLAARSFTNPTADEFLSVGTVTRRPGQPELLLLERLTLDNFRRLSA